VDGGSPFHKSPMSKKIWQLKKVLRLLPTPAHAQSLLAALKQRETRMSVKDFLARTWVGKPNTTTKE
jgi:uncharacterized membrane protein YdjX (TVP38/TMEM64 family)